MRSRFLGLEPLITERLKAAVAGLSPAVHVLAAPDLAGVKESMQKTPAIHVLFAGYRPGPEATPGIATIEQQWVTVIAVRNVSQTAQGGAARMDAGPLADLVVEQLEGHRFSGFKALHIGAAPQPGYSAGFFYLPIGWKVQTHQGVAKCESN